MQIISGFIPRRAACLALVALAGLIGAPPVMADPTTNAYLTGFGHGYDSGSGVGQGEFPVAFVNGSKDGYNFFASTRRIGLGSIFRIGWMRYVPSPAGAGLAAGQERMYFAQRVPSRL